MALALSYVQLQLLWNVCLKQVDRLARMAGPHSVRLACVHESWTDLKIPRDVKPAHIVRREWHDMVYNDISACSASALGFAMYASDRFALFDAQPCWRGLPQRSEVLNTMIKELLRAIATLQPVWLFSAIRCVCWH